MGSQLFAAQLMMSFLSGANQEIRENVRGGMFESELTGQLSSEAKPDSGSSGPLETAEIPESISMDNLPLVEALLARLGAHADTREAAMGLADGDGMLSLRDFHGLLGREKTSEGGMRESARVPGGAVREVLGTLSIPGQCQVARDVVRHTSLAEHYDVAGVRDLLGEVAGRLAPHAPPKDSSQAGAVAEGEAISSVKGDSGGQNKPLSPENSAPRIEKMIPSFAAKEKNQKEARGVFSREGASTVLSNQSQAQEGEGEAETPLLSTRKRGNGGFDSVRDPDSPKNSNVSGREKDTAQQKEGQSRGSGSNQGEVSPEERPLSKAREGRNLPSGKNLPQGSPMDWNLNALSKGEKLGGDSSEGSLGHLLNPSAEGRVRKVTVVDGGSASHETTESIGSGKVRMVAEQKGGDGASFSDHGRGGAEDSANFGHEKKDSGVPPSGGQSFFSSLLGREKGTWEHRGQNPDPSFFEGSPANGEDSSEDFPSLKRNFLKLDLEDRKLGRLMLEVETKHQEVSARLTAETEQARSVILQNSASLRQELQTQGLVLGQFQVDVQGEGGRRRGQNREEGSRGVKGQKNSSRGKVGGKLGNTHGNGKITDRLNGISFFA